MNCLKSSNEDYFTSRASSPNRIDISRTSSVVGQCGFCGCSKHNPVSCSVAQSWEEGLHGHLNANTDCQPPVFSQANISQVATGWSFDRLMDFKSLRSDGSDKESYLAMEHLGQHLQQMTIAESTLSSIPDKIRNRPGVKAHATLFRRAAAQSIINCTTYRDYLYQLTCR